MTISDSFHGSIKQLSPLWFSALQILAALASGFQTLSPELGSELCCVWVPSVSHGLETLSWQEADVDYKLAFATGTCHIPLQGLKQVLLQLLIFNTSWKEFKVKSRMSHSVEENLRTGLQIVRYLQELILWVQLLYLFISFMVTTAPCN